MTTHHYKGPRAIHPCFITCTVVGHVPVFAHPEPAQKVLDTWRAMQEQRQVLIYAFVLLEHYLYLVAAADNLPKALADFRTASAKQVFEALERLEEHSLLKRLKRFHQPGKTDPASQLWEDQLPLEPVFGTEAMRAKLELIHNNPVKRGYVGDPTLYRYSSARNYAGQPGLLHITTDW